MDQLTVINGLIMIHTYVCMYVCIYIYTYNLGFRNYLLSFINVTWAISVMVILVLEAPLKAVRVSWPITVTPCQG